MWLDMSHKRYSFSFNVFCFVFFLTERKPSNFFSMQAIIFPFFGFSFSFLEYTQRMVYDLISWVLKRVRGHAFFRFSLYPMFDEKKKKQNWTLT